MTKMSIAGALAVLATLAAFGCDGATESDIEMRVSAIGGHPGNLVTSPVRGYRVNDKHSAVYRLGNGPMPFAMGLGHLSGTPDFNTSRAWLGFIAPGSSPWGYVRSDGVEAALHVGSDMHVYERTSPGGVAGMSGTLDYFQPPTSAPLAAPAPADGPVPDVIGYVRSDGKTAVVYKSSNDHVQQILRDPSSGAWTVTDLTMASSATVTANKGSAFPYVRTDGYTTIVYIGSDNRIHELASLDGTSWGDYDLSYATGNFVVPSTDPWGYKRSDGYNCILFVGMDNNLHEFALFPGMTNWFSNPLPAVSPKGGLDQRPSAYVRWDSLNVVVYVGNDNAVHELMLVGGWFDSTLPIPTGVIPVGQVFGHRAIPYWNAVTFFGQGADGLSHGYALRMKNTAGGGSTAWTSETIF